MRWTDPKPGTTVPLELSANMLAHARLSASTPGTFSLDTFSITEQPEPAFVGAPVITRAEASGSAQITPSSAATTTRFLLRVPAAALTGETTYPRLGRLFVSTTVTDWSGAPDEARVAVSAGDRSIDGYGGIAGELEWLSLCAAEACEVPIAVTTSYWESTGSGKTSSPSGFMALDWHLEVRLEDFGTNEAPLPAIELVAR